MRAENSSLPEEWVLPRSWSKNTPGERCSCETMTRSVPLIDEGAVVGHQRQFAEIDLLLAHVLDGLLGAGGFLVEHDQAHLDAQRRRVGQPAQLALLDVEHRLAEPIAHVLERRIARIARDREHALECGVQTDARARFLGRVRLQEPAIGIELDGQQVRHSRMPGCLPKSLRMRFFSVKE